MQKKKKSIYTISVCGYVRLKSMSVIKQIELSTIINVNTPGCPINPQFTDLAAVEFI